MSTPPFPVLDPGQLRRIESVHGGFLYQHLFGAGILLLAPSTGVLSVLPERDEDVEVRLADRHVYCQIKTRSLPLQYNDIEATLSHFESLRVAHQSARTSVQAEFWIVANVPLSSSLAKRLASPEWPADVRISFPGSSGTHPAFLPPSWHDVTEAVQWCSGLAGKLPYSRLGGETLTWKLAALMQHASAGTPPREDHQFRVTELPDLFELITLQFQRFPQAPVPFRELEREPSVTSRDRVRVVVGHSGSGKSSWAAEANRHVADSVAYFDMGDVPSDGVTTALARELAARFMIRGETLATMLAPGVAGLDALRVLDGAIGISAAPRLVVIDNAHRISPETIAAAVNATQSLRWMILAQPSLQTSRLLSMLDATAEPIAELTLDSIAGEFGDRGMKIDVALANRVKSVAGGLPLFVRQAASLAVVAYGADAARMCEELEGRTHVTMTGQELLLSANLGALSSSARQVVVLLSLSEVPLSSDECRSLITTSLDTTILDAARSLRELDAAGITQSYGSSLQIHDIFRLASSEYANEVSAPARAKALMHLKDLLIRSIKDQWDFARQAFLFRLLPQTGDTATLIDIATGNDEMFAELGFVPLVSPLLEKAAANTLLSAEDRFWALDTLVFWDLQDRRDKSAAERVPLLERLFEQAVSTDKRLLAALLIKQIVLAGRVGNASRARKAFRRACRDLIDDPATLRILRYDLAGAFFCCKNYEGVVSITAELVVEYYDVLGLTSEDVCFKNPPDIEKKLDPNDHTVPDTLKRLADTLELQAMALNRMGRRGPLARLHAHKFYLMASAITSAVRVGQDVVDEMMEMNNIEDAFQFLESSVLPLVQHFRLFDKLVPVRAQRAVILAHLGRNNEALEEMSRLDQFALAAPQRAELSNQRLLVASLVNAQNTTNHVVTTKEVADG